MGFGQFFYSAPPFSAPHHLYNPVCRLQKCGLQADCTNCEVRGMACNPRCSAAEEGCGSILLEESNGTGPIPPTSKTKKLAISAALPRPVWAGGAQKLSGAENKKTKKSTIPARKLFGIGCRLNGAHEAPTRYSHTSIVIRVSAGRNQASAWDSDMSH